MSRKPSRDRDAEPDDATESDAPEPDAATAQAAALMHPEAILAGLDAARAPLQAILAGLENTIQAVRAAQALVGSTARLRADESALKSDLDALHGQIELETTEHAAERQAWVERQKVEVTEHAERLRQYEAKVTGDLEQKQRLLEANLAARKESDEQRTEAARQDVERLRSEIQDLSRTRAGLDATVMELTGLRDRLRNEINELQQRVNRLADERA